MWVTVFILKGCQPLAGGVASLNPIGTNLRQVVLATKSEQLLNLNG